MKFNSQIGKSFIEILGVLLLISVACGFGFSKYTQDKHHQNMLEIVETMHTFFERYQTNAADIFKQNSVSGGASLIKSYGLMDTCHEQESLFNKYKNVCGFALGEIDFTANIAQDYVQSYVYVHFTDMYKKYSCRQFLSIGWEKVLPKNWWNEEGYIGIVSENTNGKMFFSYNPNYIRNDGAQSQPTYEHVKNVCNYCKGSRYCTIMFAFTLTDEELKNITFPSEEVGESKPAKDDENAKVSKKGNTYAKKSGNTLEVVTFSNNGFKGVVYTGRSISGVYEGTYSSKGITSYTSYADTAKRNVLQNIKNVVYDKNGKVQSYENGPKKILLTGNADNCLIMDNSNNARQFSHCAQLFQKEKSSVLLQYDDNGMLKEVVVDGAEKKAYSFAYDQTGQLTDYCEADGKKCHKVKNGKTVKDILNRDIPQTSNQFDKLYQQHEKSPQQARAKQRILTQEEALKRVKDSGNKIKIIFK